MLVTPFSVLDTVTNTVIATVAVGSNPGFVAVNPAGTRVYVTNSSDSTVSVLDTATNTVTATVPVGSDPVGVAVNPAGTRVYVANRGSYSVFVLDTATNTVTATVSGGKRSRWRRGQPDGHPGVYNDRRSCLLRLRPRHRYEHRDGRGADGVGGRWRRGQPRGDPGVCDETTTTPPTPSMSSTRPPTA